MTRYIAFDAETGGITEDTSLLTLYAVCLDEHFEKIGDIDLKLKPNNRAPYIVTAEALGINKIDLVAHDAVAITESEGGQLFRKFLWHHSLNGKIKLVPIGHNVGFDEKFIWAHLLGQKEYEKYASYRKLDTAVVGQFLKARGDIPESVSGSLGSFVSHYGLEFHGSAHEAAADTLATVEVLKKMLGR